MATLFEEAKAYEPKRIKNIAELETIPTDLLVKEELEAEFPYKYVEMKGERYKIPVSVLAQLKVVIKEIPTLKKFKVGKSGDGLNTQYQVIPILN